MNIRQYLHDLLSQCQGRLPYVDKSNNDTSFFVWDAVKRKMNNVLIRSQEEVNR
jgi:hypothetical protein